MIEWIVALAKAFLANVLNPEWLAGEILSWLIFTVLVAYFIYWRDTKREERENEPYQRWTLLVVGYGEPAEGFAEMPQKLYPDDVKRFLLSDFELWKFVKSVVSGTVRVKLRTVDKARNSWVFIDQAARQITVDLLKIPGEHASAWEATEPPHRKNLKP